MGLGQAIARISIFRCQCSLSFEYFLKLVVFSGKMDHERMDHR